MPKSIGCSILTAGYWNTAFSEFHNHRSLIFAGLTIAISTVLSALYIPVGVNLRVTTSFLAIALGSMVFGPAVGLCAGLTSDFIGYLITPSTVFFPGYTLSTMLEFLINGVFFYRRKITVPRVLLCKSIVNFGIHVGLGCLWSSILFGKGYYYFLVKSLVKNTTLLPFEVILLYTVLKLFYSILEKQNILPKLRN